MPVTGIPGVIKEGPHQMSLFTSSPSLLLPFSPLYLLFASLYPLFPHLLSTTYESPLRSQVVCPCSGPIKHLVSRYLVWFIFDLLMKLNPNDAMFVTHGRDAMVGKHVPRPQAGRIHSPSSEFHSFTSGFAQRSYQQFSLNGYCFIMHLVILPLQTSRRRSRGFLS